ncbi:hypothetical protein P154DRAFT_577488 [Amniculicola lignicola CBS 123094]|uniref:Uncharacterized protein n=1 Tax=Amniculicola lignicola CBS 123094 TaxID=1392246 RepID=A0A6A5WDJ4_9PLEO|nr:hypothetical protein P154DRAFT_577488 [Amniculicola lignicola CBS 123094]
MEPGDWATHPTRQPTWNAQEDTACSSNSFIEPTWPPSGDFRLEAVRVTTGAGARPCGPHPHAGTPKLTTSTSAVTVETLVPKRRLLRSSAILLVPSWFLLLDHGCLGPASCFVLQLPLLETAYRLP